MNGIRLVLLAVGCLLVLAACGVLIGAIDSAREGDAASPWLWLSILLAEVVLVSIAVVLFRFASRIARGQGRGAGAATQSEAAIELFCPTCDSGRLAQGPENPGLLFRKSYEARCLECGARVKVSAEDWRRLPLPEVGDAYETSADREHLMRWLPMTTGQTVFVLLGLFGWVVIVIALGVDKYEVSAPAFLIVVGCWWLGRLLFRPKASSEWDGN